MNSRRVSAGERRERKGQRLRRVVAGAVWLGAVAMALRAETSPRAGDNVQAAEAHRRTRWARLVLGLSLFTGAAVLGVVGFHRVAGSSNPARPHGAGGVVFAVGGLGADEARLNVRGFSADQATNQPALIFDIRPTVSDTFEFDTEWLLVASGSATVASQDQPPTAGFKFRRKDLRGVEPETVTVARGDFFTDVRRVVVFLDGPVENRSDLRSIGALPYIGPLEAFNDPGRTLTSDGDDFLWREPTGFDLLIQTELLQPFHRVIEVSPNPIEVTPSIIWDGSFGLQAFWETESVDIESKANRDGLIAGIVFGLAGTMLVAALQLVLTARE